MATGSCRAAREIVEQCFKWSSQRKVFGKPLIAQPVIRQHLAEMLQLVEAEQSWLENIVFQMTTMPSYAEQSDKLAGAFPVLLHPCSPAPGQISLLKSFCTRNAGKIADKAVQVRGSSLVVRH